MSNSLLSFAKLEFVDMDTLEVRHHGLGFRVLRGRCVPCPCWEQARPLICAPAGAETLAAVHVSLSSAAIAGHGNTAVVAMSTCLPSHAQVLQDVETTLILSL